MSKKSNKKNLNKKKSKKKKITNNSKKNVNKTKINNTVKEKTITNVQNKKVSNNNTKKQSTTSKKNIPTVKKVTNKNNSSKKKYNKFVKKIQEYIKKLKKEVSKKVLIIKTNLNKRREEKYKSKLLNKEEVARRKEELKKEVIDEPIEVNTTISIKLIISLVAIAILIIFMVALFNKDKENKIEFNEIGIKEYKKSYQSGNLNYIYVKSNNCEYCPLIEPYLDRLEKDCKITINLLNVNKLSNKEKEELKQSSDAFDGNWDIPVLLSIKDGKEISNIKGYKEYSALKKFVENSNNPTDSNSFIKISINKYLSILKKEEISIIYIGRSKSSGCEIYVPVLEKVTQNKKIQVYYLDTDSLNSEEDWSKLENSNAIFKETWFTPVTLIVKDSKIIGYKMESMDEETLEYFLNKNGV